MIPEWIIFVSRGITVLLWKIRILAAVLLQIWALSNVFHVQTYLSTFMVKESHSENKGITVLGNAGKEFTGWHDVISQETATAICLCFHFAFEVGRSVGTFCWPFHLHTNTWKTSFNTFITAFLSPLYPVCSDTWQWTTVLSRWSHFL